MIGYYTITGIWSPAALALREAGTKLQIRSMPAFDGVVEKQFTAIVIEAESEAIRNAYEAVGIEVESASTPVTTVEDRPAPKKSTKKQ